MLLYIRLVFSQSLLALDLIEDFLEFMDSQRKSSDETDKVYHIDLPHTLACKDKLKFYVFIINSN